VDPVATAKILAQGAFFHAGQICMATSRILATPGIYPRLVEALAREAESLFLGSLRDEKTAYGPLIHAQSLAKVKAHVDEARGAGAQLVTGGNVRRGLVYEPTVLAAPSTTSAVWREETFGPVTCILPVSNTDEAVALANDSPYGLSACVLTERVSDAFTLARRLRAGSVHIGMHSFQSNAMAPIGGVGMSGLGKSGGKYSIEAFTELKWVSVELGTPPFLHAP
jgi:aldehyde dehydrogenase (NAD+)